MKKILLILTAFLFALSSCVHLGDLELEPVPDIAFTYTQNSGLEFTFTSSVEGTTNVGWEVIGIEGATATGDSFTYNFPEPGTYWVRMTVTYNGGEQTFTGKIAPLCRPGYRVGIGVRYVRKGTGPRNLRPAGRPQQGRQAVFLRKRSLHT